MKTSVFSYLFAGLIGACTLQAVSISTKQNSSVEDSSIFNYDLHLFSIPGKGTRTMLLFHGYGGNYQIAKVLKQLNCLDATLVSFNFPDHDLSRRTYDPYTLTFGTIDEILPALYVLKKLVIDEGRDSIDLYGFSAGGGVLVNLIGILNTSRYESQLKRIGIQQKEKKQLLDAIQKGIVILDVPLKSVEEIIQFRGSSPELEIVANNYRNNHFRPIDSLAFLEGLSLTAAIHFQEADEILYNRDDALYIETFKKVNQLGTTFVVIGNDGGHLKPHWSLWRFLCSKFNSQNSPL